MWAVFAKVAEVANYLKTNLSTTRAAKIDNLDTTINSRQANWGATTTHRDRIDTTVSSRQASWGAVAGTKTNIDNTATNVSTIKTNVGSDADASSETGSVHAKIKHLQALLSESSSGISFTPVATNSAVANRRVQILPDGSIDSLPVRTFVTHTTPSTMLTTTSAMAGLYTGSDSIEISNGVYLKHSYYKSDAEGGGVGPGKLSLVRLNNDNTVSEGPTINADSSGSNVNQYVAFLKINNTTVLFFYTVVGNTYYRILTIDTDTLTVSGNTRITLSTGVTRYVMAPTLTRYNQILFIHLESQMYVKYWDFNPTNNTIINPSAPTTITNFSGATVRPSITQMRDEGGFVTYLVGAIDTSSTTSYFGSYRATPTGITLLYNHLTGGYGTKWLGYLVTPLKNGMVMVLQFANRYNGKCFPHIYIIRDDAPGNSSLVPPNWTDSMEFDFALDVHAVYTNVVQKNDTEGYIEYIIKGRTPLYYTSDEGGYAYLKIDYKYNNYSTSPWIYIPSFSSSATIKYPEFAGQGGRKVGLYTFTDNGEQYVIELGGTTTGLKVSKTWLPLGTLSGFFDGEKVHLQGIVKSAGTSLNPSVKYGYNNITGALEPDTANQDTSAINATDIYVNYPSF